jgi:TRAP-type C4-dicarboxylate transport system permease small subunit
MWFEPTFRWLHQRAENLAALILGSMFAAFLVQVLFRYFLNVPLGWTIEYVTVAWLWGILFGYAFVLADAEIVKLDLVYNIVPIPVRRVMDVVSNVVVTAILLWSLPKAFGYVVFMAREKTAFMHIPFDLLFSIYAPFVLAVCVRNLRQIWRAVRNVGYGPGSAAPAANEPVLPGAD